ncbi:hypothetical protein FRB94_008587 [Tulasnella sp. JGI-2019a]|nr:hypothetical protein FRB93_007679 [Tulasnella sp. JGI-2019a]KAG8996066.1 hypothetical protein FRB94_008587 [Tulasnella sp. JGI-2019a]
MSNVATNQEISIIEWTARVRCNEHALGGSYSVLIFLGLIPEDPKDWRVSPSLVGMHGVYTDDSGGYGGYGSSGQGGNTVDREVEGYVKLNRALMRSGIPSFKEEDVIPYLRDNLGWRIQKVTGEVVPISNLPSLEVEVLSSVLKRSPTDQVPMPIGSPKHHHEVTSGRPGGHRA